MDKEECKKKYQELFPSDFEKARAFDKIASHYYMKNFGSISKSDIDLLIFSEYLDRMLNISEYDMDTYSDYELSKLLGITQARVASLKERKELIYPYEGFDWKKSLLRITERARFDNGKIVLYVPDRNLFIEIRNEIEKRGGYVDVQLNRKLLKVSPEYYIQLLIQISDSETRAGLEEKVKKEIINEIKKNSKDNSKLANLLEQKSLSENIHEIGINVAGSLISNLITGDATGCVSDIAKIILHVIKIMGNII